MNKSELEKIVCEWTNSDESWMVLVDKIIKYQDVESLRDKFAGQALTGILSNGDTVAVLERDMRGQYDSGKALAAGMAYRLADAMLAERAKEAHHGK